MLGDSLQHLIADQMAVRVIELFEVVQIDHHHRQTGALTQRPRLLTLEKIDEIATIEQPGEWVMQRLLAELRVQGRDSLQALPLRLSASANCSSLR